MQMLPWVGRFFWIWLLSTSLVMSLSLWLEVKARELISTDWDDYDQGWFTAGIRDPEQLPVCEYCINALGDGSATNNARKPDWNRTVGLYRCDGAQTNEVWAFQNSTNSIVYSNLRSELCLDALLWQSNLLKLRDCNSSVITQQWKYEDHHLVSGLLDRNGKSMYLWAVPPDLGTNPSNQNYTYPLFIASTSPTDSFSYTPNFTFIPTTKLVKRNVDKFTTEGLLSISNSSEPGQIANGGFETSMILAGGNIAATNWNQTYPSYFAFCGWVIDYGPIDYVQSGFLAAQSGKYSIHLNTHTDLNHHGSISQTIRTDAGTQYVLSFFLTGFPPVLVVPGRPGWQCGSPYDEARLQVQLTNATTMGNLSGLLNTGTGITQNFTANVTGLTAENMQDSWTKHTLVFTATTNVTTISFSSLNINNSCGPMIDTIDVQSPQTDSPLTVGARPARRKKVVPVIAGSIAGLVGLTAIVGIVCGTSLCRTREDFSKLYKTEHAKVYSVKELSIATKKFSSVLGEGGFGTVYRADFLDGTVAAVKVEKPRGLISSSKVLATDEIALLLRVHHRNLVNLIGFGIDKGRHMLVFEYLPNGSLHERLHQSILPSHPGTSMDAIELSRLRSTVIPWSQRLKIAANVACGLEYLHHEADPPIVHRDIKSQNILLTATDSAKLADFGLSKAAPRDATTVQSFETLVRGSIGYLDPQYLLTGVFSPKSDVYSFGVVLLELVSGHPAVYNAVSLASWAAPYITDPALYHELVDKRLDGDVPADELESMVELSKMCMQEDGKMRPSMRQVVAFINSRQLQSIAEDSSEHRESLSKENYEKTRAKFLDFESIDDSSSGGVFRSMVLDVAEPRD